MHRATAQRRSRQLSRSGLPRVLSYLPIPQDSRSFPQGRGIGGLMRLAMRNGANWSGREDSNLRPLPPETSVYSFTCAFLCFLARRNDEKFMQKTPFRGVLRRDCVGGKSHRDAVVVHNACVLFSSQITAPHRFANIADRPSDRLASRSRRTRLRSRSHPCHPK